MGGGGAGEPQGPGWGAPPRPPVRLPPGAPPPALTRPRGLCISPSAGCPPLRLNPPRAPAAVSALCSPVSAPSPGRLCFS